MARSEKRTGSTKKASVGKKSTKQTNPISRYMRETRGELRKVTWPTREESWRLTMIVLGVTFLMAVFLWFFDSIFSSSLQFLLERVIGI